QEIDGASYNGVDEVRRLQESLPYRPSRDRFKIVIVDEVHMLSQAAWNAFLKTLEEPPPHVKFIFATTEVHKVPVTILSRCQRYDFKLIPAQVIAKRLRYVLDQESIEADDASVALMAREAAGSMRDAMSLLDQAIAWGGQKLVGDEIAQVLGVAGHTDVRELASALVRGDAAACVTIVDRLAGAGYDLVHVARNLLEALRDLVVVKLCKDHERMVDLTAEELVAISTIAREAELDDLLRLHLGVSQSFDQVVQAPQQRAAFEMMLVRMARRPPMLPVDDLIGRLSQLEKRIHGTGGAAARPAARPRAIAEGLSEPPIPSRAVDAGHRPSAPAIPQPAPVPARSASVPPSSEPPRSQPRSAAEGAAVASASQRPQIASSVTPQGLAAWRQIVDRVRAANPGYGSVMEHAVPLDVTAEKVELGFEPGSFYETQAKHEGVLDLVTRVVRDHFGASTAVSFTLDAVPTGAQTIYAVEEKERAARIAAERKELTDHPLVQAAVRELGARIQEIKLAKSG
ncbi:MAG TPA: DNA polymerase III subunit gamma/tau, partial [Polyangiaceae bacterium]|nr:DNA polymerase III subunit gamma/tau [Polyangiaceae bacterium]